MNSEWPLVSIKSICVGIFDGPHATPKKTTSGPVFLGITSLNRGQLDRGSFEFLSEEDFIKWTKRVTPQAGDVVFSYETRLGEVALIPPNLRCCLGRRMALMRIDRSKADPAFVVYAFLAPAFQEVIRRRTIHGSTVDRLPLTEFGSFPITLPPLDVQHEVVGILQALDDRITLLRETNATLEAIAQALFKSWFVDFDPVRAKMEGRAPEGMEEATAALFPDGFEESALGLVPNGWRSGELGEVARTIRKQLQPSELHARLHYVGLEHMPRKSLSLVNWGTADGLESAKAAFQEGDILFGKLRPYFHKVVIAPFDGVCSTDVLVCQAVKPAFYGFVVIQLFSDALVGYAERLSNGAKMPRVNWSDLAAYPVVVPTEDVAAGFAEAVAPLFSQMKASAQTAQTLASLRNTLLPRLISGQLRLTDAQKEIREATT